MVMKRVFGLRNSLAILNNHAKHISLVCIFAGTLGACGCCELGSEVAGSGKLVVICSAELEIGAKTRLVSVLVVTFGCSAWHKEEADEPGLCGRKRSGGSEGGRQGGGC